MARKVGQIVRRGARTSVVRVYDGWDSETKKRKDLNQSIYGGLRDARFGMKSLSVPRGSSDHSAISRAFIASTAAWYFEQALTSIEVRDPFSVAVSRP